MFKSHLRTITQIRSRRTALVKIAYRLNLTLRNTSATVRFSPYIMFQKIKDNTKFNLFVLFFWSFLFRNHVFMGFLLPVFCLYVCFLFFSVWFCINPFGFMLLTCISFLYSTALMSHTFSMSYSFSFVSHHRKIGHWLVNVQFSIEK